MAKGSEIEGASRGNMFKMDPDLVVIPGIDTKGDESAIGRVDPKRYSLNDPDMEALVLSVMEHGVRQAIEIRRNGSKVEAVDGARRIIAAREAKRRGSEMAQVIPLSPPIKASDSKALMLMISLNELRKDDSFKTRAALASRLQQMGVSLEEMVTTFGKQKITVQGYLAYWDLSKKVQKAMDDGRLAPWAGVELAKHSREEQDEMLDKMIEESGTGTVTVAAVRKANREKAGKEETVSKAMVKRILKNEKADKLDPNIVKAMRWFIDDLDSKAIGGLKAILDDIRAQDEQKAAERLERQNNKETAEETAERVATEADKASKRKNKKADKKEGVIFQASEEDGESAEA